ncbi:fusaric acid resistance family protein [Kribbella amoyensis]|uniref:Fusaric acid resistance family protein n=1 Tax=Kribbella amoyensis TaxID=996641 RepID=A0A561BLH6_9ACTN|nr:FUSC family protein [Kribbella amoyensis]TWD79709.1 fusaric acid resistance family protein [Kribbella amoyensis]
MAANVVRSVADRLYRVLGTDLLQVRPAPAAHRVAARAALSMLIALLTLWWFDRVEWALYATFGAFTSVFGGGLRSPGRWKLQIAVGLTLTAAVACGVLIALHPERTWLAVPAAAAWAALAAALSDHFHWKPPGALFPVFAVAACSSVPITAANVLPAIAVTASTAALAILLGVLEDRLAPPPPQATPPPAPPPAPLPRIVNPTANAAAVLIAGGIATASGISHPYWAMIAAVAPLAAVGFRKQFVRGVHRAAGTLIGIFLAVPLLALDLPVLAILVAVPALQGTAELLIARNYGAALIVITPLALLLVDMAHAEPISTLVTDRLVETVIGVTVGLTIALLIRPRRSPTTET